MNQKAGQITRPPATWNGLSADSVYEDETGDLWMLTHSPIVGLVKYDRRSERFTKYPLDPGAAGILASTMNGGSLNGRLVADGTNGLWVPSSQDLYYFARRTQLQQVLVNLMLNAIEAMKETGGVLTVKSQRDEADQIFNAFFTTKPQGLGMGLAISRSIVESYGGRLWATPNDGRGASFHFTLPKYQNEKSSARVA